MPGPEHEAAARNPPVLAVAAPAIRAPALPVGLVSRTPLVNRLRAASSPVVLVTAPAGYGKTTILAQWESRDPRPFAWVSLDERDREPSALLRQVAGALRAVAPLEPHVLEAVAAPGPSVWASALPRLAASLHASEPLVLVFDDAHVLAASDALEVVAALADDLSEGSTLVLAGRVALPLPIPALRAAGTIVEVGADQLAFSPREAQLLLRTGETAHDFETVTALVRECEGWPAVLALAAAGRHGYASPRELGVDAYVREECLSRLHPELLRFLRRTAVLDEMCGGLCDAVLREEGSGAALAGAERAGLFLVPLDRQSVWYRYRRPFRDVLRRELAAREPRLVPVLHARAADWYEAHGEAEAALEHAAAGGDLDRAARLLAAIALPLYHRGRVTTVEGWLERFDDPDLLARHPAVAPQAALIHTLRGRPAEAERWLATAEAGLGAVNRPRALAVARARIAAVRAALCGDGACQMVADAESALSGLGRDDPVRPFALTVLGVGHVLLGQSARADAILAEGEAEAARLGATDVRAIAIAERSIVAAARGEAEAAESLALEAKEIVEEAGVAGYETSAIALAASARGYLRNGMWEEARAELERAREARSSGRGAVPWLAVQTGIELARTHLALREVPAVRLLLAEIRARLHTCPHLGILVDEADALEAEADSLPKAERAGPGLTPAELRLLPFLTTHLSFREIGERLYVSRNTIKTQAISIYRKLGATSRSDAIAAAARLGLVETGSPRRRSPSADDAG